MRREKELQIVQHLVDSTEAGKIVWKPVAHTNEDVFVAALESGQMFRLSCSESGSYLEGDTVRLEIRDSDDALVAEIGATTPRITDMPFAKATDRLRALLALREAVYAQTETPLDETLDALKQLSV